jgi:hypothetical protein
MRKLYCVCIKDEGFKEIPFFSLFTPVVPPIFPYRQRRSRHKQAAAKRGVCVACNWVAGGVVGTGLRLIPPHPLWAEC